MSEKPRIRVKAICISVPLTGEPARAVVSTVQPQAAALATNSNSSLVSAMTEESATAPDLTDPPVAVAATNSIDPGPCGFDLEIPAFLKRGTDNVPPFRRLQ